MDFSNNYRWKLHKQNYLMLVFEAKGKPWYFCAKNGILLLHPNIKKEKRSFYECLDSQCSRILMQ